jgi:multiple antibiotic resistance protein
MDDFWLCFVPYFVAVDSVGVLPLFLGLTEEYEPEARRRIILQSLLTAFLVALLFILVGPAILRLVGVGVADFMVAGGILLLVLSLVDIVTGEKRQRQFDAATVGAVPLGVPLITGPAVLATSLLLANEYGILPTVLALLANIVIAGLVFNFAARLVGFLGQAGSRTLSKVASLFLAAIAVMLIRKGVFAILGLD